MKWVIHKAEMHHSGLNSFLQRLLLSERGNTENRLELAGARMCRETSQKAFQPDRHQGHSCLCLPRVQRSAPAGRHSYCFVEATFGPFKAVKITLQPPVAVKSSSYYPTLHSCDSFWPPVSKPLPPGSRGNQEAWRRHLGVSPPGRLGCR